MRYSSKSAESNGGSLQLYFVKTTNGSPLNYLRWKKNKEHTSFVKRGGAQAKLTKTESETQSLISTAAPRCHCSEHKSFFHTESNEAEFF